MNIRDLKYLVALADSKHFGKAAKTCYVSQPTLSMQIKKLENSLEVQLLERTNKSVMLTAIGEILAERARNILKQVDDLRETAKLTKDPYSGEIKVGIIPTLAAYLLPKIMPQLTALFPKLKQYLIEEQTSVLIEKLNQGKLDATILSLPITNNNFVTEPLFEEEFLLAVSPQHALAKHKVIKEKDLQNKNLLLLDEGHCLHGQALELCHSMKISEEKDFRATSLETLRHMVAINMGMTLIPKLACKKDNTVSYVPFNAPKPSRSIAMLWRSSTAKELLLKEIAKNIKKIMIKELKLSTEN